MLSTCGRRCKAFGSSVPAEANLALSLPFLALLELYASALNRQCTMNRCNDCTRYAPSACRRLWWSCKYGSACSFRDARARASSFFVDHSSFVTLQCLQLLVTQKELEQKVRAMACAQCSVLYLHTHIEKLREGSMLADPPVDDISLWPLHVPATGTGWEPQVH